MVSLKSKGNQHVSNVYTALKQLLNSEKIESYSTEVKQTVDYIANKFLNIEAVQVKFDFPKPDEHPDLTLYLKDGEAVKVNLFSIEGKQKIQPKNIGAKSFLEKYFQSEGLQSEFNRIVAYEYDQFLTSVIETVEEVNIYSKTRDLKAKVNVLYPSFTDKINPIRKSFLFNLRKQLFELLQQAQSTMAEGFLNGFKELMLLDSINIITDYKSKNNCSAVEEWKPAVQFDNEMELYKKGNDTVGIRIGETALTLRLKFESSPTSSIKLATSYDLFPLDNERVKINEATLKKFNKLKKNPTTTHKTDPNAIGKCNEALVYASFVEKYPSVYQVDPKEFITMYETYVPKVKEQAADYLIESAKVTIEEIELYLTKKYTIYELESIQLVPQNYIKNRLDTADLLLTLNINGRKIDTYFSLKAVAKLGSQITVKNPGIGTILGADFFAIGSMSDVVDQVKLLFEQGVVNHQESLEEVSVRLGERLSQANQEKLKKGLTALFGKAPTVVTFYEAQQCVIKEHGKIESEVNVLIQKPTLTNTTLNWNDGQDEIKLRVKFSGGQQKGWSSLKLAGEYRLRRN